MSAVRHEGAAAVRHHPSLVLLASEEQMKDALLRERWRALLKRTPHLQGLYMSPEWLDHIDQIEKGASVSVLAHRGPDGAFDGVVPLARAPVELDYVVKHYILRRQIVDAIAILGGQPLLDEQVPLFDQAFATIAQKFPECDAITLSMVPKESFTWRYLNESRFIRDHFILYVPQIPGAGLTHSINLPNTFDKYNTSLTAKRRANCKRKVKVLHKQGKPPTLSRFETASQVPDFLEQVIPLSRKTWQHALIGEQLTSSLDWNAKLRDLAERDIFRGYVMKCGDQIAAFGLGHQQGGVFHLNITGYDESLGALSPGSVLIYTMIEDLLKHRPVQRLCFCFGDARYKREFGNVHTDTVKLMLFRKNLKNTVLRYTHAGFRGAVNFAKQHLRKELILRRNRDVGASIPPPAGEESDDG